MRDFQALAVIDARHGNYYACGYEDKSVTYSPAFINESELEELAKEYEIVKLEDSNLQNGLINAVASKIEEATFDRESVVPLYVKKSQAEEEADVKKVD